MTIELKKQRERRKMTDLILDRFWDGKINDEGEMYDRLLLYRQLEALFQAPRKENLEKII